MKFIYIQSRDDDDGFNIMITLLKTCVLYKVDEKVECYKLKNEEKKNYTLQKIKHEKAFTLLIFKSRSHCFFFHHVVNCTHNLLSALITYNKCASIVYTLLLIYLH